MTQAQFSKPKNTERRDEGLSFYHQAATFEEALNIFAEDTPEGLIKMKPGGQGRKDAYIEWHSVAEILDRVCPKWTHSIKSVSQIGNFVSVVAVINIDGVTREGLGTGPADSELGIKKAESDALKRAAVKFGVGRDLREKDEDTDNNSSFRQNSNNSNRTTRQPPPASRPAGNVVPLNKPNQSSPQSADPIATREQLTQLAELQRGINNTYGLKLDAEKEFADRFQTKVGNNGEKRTVTKSQCLSVFADFQEILNGKRQEEKQKLKTA